MSFFDHRSDIRESIVVREVRYTTFTHNTVNLRLSLSLHLRPSHHRLHKRRQHTRTRIAASLRRHTRAEGDLMRRQALFSLLV